MKKLSKNLVLALAVSAMSLSAHDALNNQRGWAPEIPMWGLTYEYYQMAYGDMPPCGYSAHNCFH